MKLKPQRTSRPVKNSQRGIVGNLGRWLWFVLIRAATVIIMKLQRYELFEIDKLTALLHIEGQICHQQRVLIAGIRESKITLSSSVSFVSEVGSLEGCFMNTTKPSSIMRRLLFTDVCSSFLVLRAFVVFFTSRIPNTRIVFDKVNKQLSIKLNSIIKRKKMSSCFSRSRKHTVTGQMCTPLLSSGRRETACTQCGGLTPRPGRRRGTQVCTAGILHILYDACVVYAA
ncbi:hypothetical protein WA026_023668 [Henosepilachna vigintioctopunctata]|uniref:Uncharacterized protein n=1 Tax=Henosepilachna vigintioctopunctata TaxID=420089 RepID=A0AAW1UDE3_9CUCU